MDRVAPSMAGDQAFLGVRTLMRLGASPRAILLWGDDEAVDVRPLTLNRRPDARDAPDR
jgi:hypothetical protein